MTGFESKRQAAQDKMELADAYASAVAATPNMPTPLERKLAVERIERARNALEAALEQQQDKLDDEQADQIIGGLQTCHHQSSKREFLKVWLRDWAAHNIKEQP